MFENQGLKNQRIPGSRTFFCHKNNKLFITVSFSFIWKTRGSMIDALAPDESRMNLQMLRHLNAYQVFGHAYRRQHPLVNSPRNRRLYRLSWDEGWSRELFFMRGSHPETESNIHPHYTHYLCTHKGKDHHEIAMLPSERTATGRRRCPCRRNKNNKRVQGKVLARTPVFTSPTIIIGGTSRLSLSLPWDPAPVSYFAYLGACLLL